MPTKSETPPAEPNTGEATGTVLLSRGLKVASEGVVPGASLILDGQVMPGVIHMVGGLLARAALGPIGGLLVAANSYSTSVTGKNLLEQFTGHRAGRHQRWAGAANQG